MCCLQSCIRSYMLTVCGFFSVRPALLYIRNTLTEKSKLIYNLNKCNKVGTKPDQTHIIPFGKVTPSLFFLLAVMLNQLLLPGKGLREQKNKTNPDWQTHGELTEWCAMSLRPISSSVVGHLNWLYPVTNCKCIADVWD